MSIYNDLYKIVNKGLIKASVEPEDSSDLLINLNPKMKKK